MQYSGATVAAIQDALPLKTWSILNSPSSLLERGINRINGSKYTMKLKCFENGMADDGYKWRKYGQKAIKNSPYPRSYYKCTNRRCSAKKQVERSRDEQDTLIITYEGLHLHFAYPYYFPLNPDDGEDHHPPPPPKRTKTTSPEAELAEAEAEAEQSRFGGEEEGLFEMKAADSSQGLLEDVVLPFVIRYPATVDNVNSSSRTSSSNLLISNSCSSTSSSLSWSSSSQDSE